MISLIHRLVAIPAVYDLSQRLAGARICWEKLRQALQRLPHGSRVIDVGAGTGLAKKLFPPGCIYTACEPDPQKRQGLKKICPEDAIMEASATQIPASDESFDACLLTAVAHHLTDQEFDAAIREFRRILTPQGTFFLLDPLWVPHGVRGRILWALDRGSHPRTLAQIREFVERYFHVVEEVRWHVHHHYALLICRPKQSVGHTTKGT